MTGSVFDDLDRVKTINHPAYTRPDGGGSYTPVESFDYDANGNLISRDSRRGETTTFEFDSFNRVVRQTDPPIGADPAGVVLYEYDDVGNRTAQTDQRGARTEFVADDLDRQRTVTSVVRQTTGSPLTFTTTFGFDDLGNQTSVKNPLAETTVSNFNAVSELTSVVDRLGQSSVFAYEMGRQIRATDPLGRYTVNTYDLAGRLTMAERFAPDDTLLSTFTYGFDVAGNQVSVASPRGNESGADPARFTTVSDFDAAGRLTSTIKPVSGLVSEDIATSYGYDEAGNVTRVTNGAGEDTQISYNPWGLAEDYIEPATSAYPTLADRTFTTSYDPGGLPVFESVPGGVSVSRVFDELGRLDVESGAGAGTPSRDFGYDLAGLRTLVSAPAGNIGLVYDDRGLLVDVTGTNTAATYVYDGAGRLTDRTDAAGTSLFTWTGRGELGTVTDPLTGVVIDYSWSAASQVETVTYGTGGPERTYAYDDFGRLTSDRLDATAGGTPVTETLYDYDVDNNPVLQDVTLAGNPAEGANTYTYDNAGRIESWTIGATTTSYQFDDAGNRTQAGADAYTYDERNQLLSGPDGTYAYTARGTMATVTNGATVTDYSFDAFGTAPGLVDS